MSTHTPGPWYKDAGLVRADRVAVAAYAGNGTIRYPSNPDEVEANARLIAAAPDLLAELNSLLVITELMANGGRKSDVYWKDTAASIKAIIRKATKG